MWSSESSPQITNSQNSDFSKGVWCCKIRPFFIPTARYRSHFTTIRSPVTNQPVGLSEHMVLQNLSSLLLLVLQLVWSMTHHIQDQQVFTKNEWSWRCERLKTRCLCPVFSGVCVRKDEQTTTLCCFYVWHSVTTFIELQLYYKLHVWCSDVWWICCSKQPFWIVSLSDR